MVFLTREQIEERLVALHQASLELVSDLSQDTLLEHIVTLAREQVGARYAALGVVNEQGVLEQFIPVGMTPAQLNQMAHPPQGKGLLGALLSERHTIRLPDLTLDPRSVGFPANHPPMKSFLGVPILLGEQLLGLIYLTDKTDYSEFTQGDALVIETLAAYAAVAISNSRLYKETLEKGQALQQRNQDLSLLNAVAVSLASSLDLDEVLDHTLNRVMSYLEVESGEIFLIEEDGQELRLALHRGEAAEAFWTKDFFQKGEGTVGTVAQTGKPLVSTDLQNDMLFLRRAVVEAGFRCLASIPLTARGNVVGVMNVATRLQRCPDARKLELLTAIGSWAGITIENARLHGQARRLAILEERERIGMDLHDGIVQSIYAVGLELDFARLALDDNPKQARIKIEQAILGLNQTIGDIRAYIADLRPRQFIGAGIMEGLQRLIDEYKANTRSEAILIGPKNGLAAIPTSHSTALFHICQEALANVAKHSHAQKTEVHLWKSRDRLLMEISDNGQGFDLHKMSVTLGHGLSNMHIRARKVGGDLEITSDPGEGTTVLAWVPIQGNHADHQPK
jgi:two-component system sensor histidine kinase DevS